MFTNRKSLIYIIVVLFIILIGLLVFNWYQNNKTDIPDNNSLLLNANNVENSLPVNEFEPMETEKPTINNEPINNNKTFAGNGFSFIYPEKYITDSYGLWTADAYNRHLNPPADCSTCQIPTIEVRSVMTDYTLDQQILGDYDLPGSTLAEMSEQTGFNYESIKIGRNDFVKIVAGDMFTITGYYTKHNDQIIAFRVYWLENDDATLEQIISSLKFE